MKDVPSPRPAVPYRLAFMGTPAFAVPALRALVQGAAAGHWELAGAVTQPDRRQGRSRRLRFSPVKEEALKHALPLLQPETFRRNPRAADALAAWRPDAIVVVAYGQILPRSVLRIPPLGCLNVHASLLPALRGPSPIATALLQGLSETGTSLMLLDAGMDTGPILAQAVLPIARKDTAQSLGERLARQGAALLRETLPRWLAGQIEPRAQSAYDEPPTTCALWRKENGQIDWRRPATDIERLVRACYPWPGAYTFWQGQSFKILAADCAGATDEAGPAGRIVAGKPSGLAVQTGQGRLYPLRVQLAGRKAMDIEAFCLGAGRRMIGTRFDAAGCL